MVALTSLLPSSLRRPFAHDTRSKLLLRPIEWTDEMTFSRSKIEAEP